MVVGELGDEGEVAVGVGGGGSLERWLWRSGNASVWGVLSGMRGEWWSVVRVGGCG